MQYMLGDGAFYLQNGTPGLTDVYIREASVMIPVKDGDCYKKKKNAVVLWVIVFDPKR